MRIVLAYIWDYITTRDLPTNLVYKDTINYRGCTEGSSSVYKLVMILFGLSLLRSSLSGCHVTLSFRGIEELYVEVSQDMRSHSDNLN